MDRQIVANRLRTPSGKILRSYHRHDYVTHIEGGKTYMVDGGLDYLRRSVIGEDCSIHDDDPFNVVRKYLVWGTYGKNGDQPLTQIALCDMETDHILAVLENCHVAHWREELMRHELADREENG
jgi:hypothetical protein